MPVIRDRDGEVVQKCRNLAGIHRFVPSHTISHMDISEVGSGEGKLCILFEDGHSFETGFASFDVLKMHVRNWRNVWGAPFSVNGVDQGKVEKNHAALLVDHLEGR